MAKVSVTDQPVASKDLGDKLGTGEYALTLAQFIRECDTPITIGVQGEWGSGKTSLLNMIREDLETSSKKIQRGAEIQGKEFYKTIWVNTWEHSLLKTPEEALLSIIEEIIDEIATVDGSWNAAAKAKAALSNLAKGTLRIGATLSMGAAGGDLARDLVDSGASSNTVRQLRESLERIVQTVVDRKQNRTERFVIFVDDLDRLEPQVAVQVLELLKNIFTIDNCVFVLAIDYQVVVKGLTKKFGKMDEHNEWEFRAFFDKIIQLPFMMPMAQYDLDNYINSMLVDEIAYFAKKSEQKLLSDGTLAKAVRYTLGYNPRSMKRLLNSLSLLKLQNSLKKSDPLSDPYLRQIVFILVCCQISFPKIFELLLRKPAFVTWDDEFVKKVVGGIDQDDKDVMKALTRAAELDDEDFDESWEKALFKIVWLKGWQKNRLSDTSRLLSLIADDIMPEAKQRALPELDGEGSNKEKSDEFEKRMKLALEITAVTAVSSTDEGIFANQTDDADTLEAKERRGFWKMFSDIMSGSGSVFDPNVTPISLTHSSGYMARKIDLSNGRELHFRVRPSSSSPYVVNDFITDGERNLDLFELLRVHRDEIEKVAGNKVIWKKESSSPSIIFRGPSSVKERASLSKEGNQDDAKTIFLWLSEVSKPIEDLLVKIIEASEEVPQQSDG